LSNENSFFRIPCPLSLNPRLFRYGSRGKFVYKKSSKIKNRIFRNVRLGFTKSDPVFYNIQLLHPRVTQALSSNVIFWFSTKANLLKMVYLRAKFSFFDKQGPKICP
jgi:hypothetical protein